MMVQEVMVVLVDLTARCHRIATAGVVEGAPACVRYKECEIDLNRSYKMCSMIRPVAVAYPVDHDSAGFDQSFRIFALA